MKRALIVTALPLETRAVREQVGDTNITMLGLPLS